MENVTARVTATKPVAQVRSFAEMAYAYPIHAMVLSVETPASVAMANVFSHARAFPVLMDKIVSMDSASKSTAVVSSAPKVKPAPTKHVRKTTAIQTNAGRGVHAWADNALMTLVQVFNVQQISAAKSSMEQHNV